MGTRYRYTHLILIDVIIDFKVTNSPNCPEFYDTADFYEWPGTVEGCYCQTHVGVWQYQVVLRVFIYWHELL